MPRWTTFRLGRHCQLWIEGELVVGVSDVLVHESTEDVDATGFGETRHSTAVVARSWELTIVIPDIAIARRMASGRFKYNGQFLLPQLYGIQLKGGLVDINSRFTVHDVDADEEVDGVVMSRFVLKEWWAGDQ